MRGHLNTDCFAFSYATGFPTLVLFAGSARFYHAIAQVIVAVLLFAVVIPVQGVCEMCFLSLLDGA